MAVGFLEVDGDGVMDACADALVGEELDEGVAAFDLDGVDVEDMFCPGGLEGGDEVFEASEELIIGGGVLASELGGVIEVGEFHVEDGGLDAIHAAVPADHGVVIFFDLAVIAEDADFFVEIGVIGEDRSRLAKGAEIFAWVEAEATGIGEEAGFFSVVFGAVSLAGVFDDEDPVLAGDLEDGLEIGGVSEEVDGDDGFGFWGDRLG